MQSFTEVDKEPVFKNPVVVEQKSKMHFVRLNRLQDGLPRDDLLLPDPEIDGGPRSAERVADCPAVGVELDGRAVYFNRKLGLVGTEQQGM